MSVHLCWRFAKCEARKHGAPTRLYAQIGGCSLLLGWREFEITRWVK